MAKFIKLTTTKMCKIILRKKLITGIYWDNHEARTEVHVNYPDGVRMHYVIETPDEIYQLYLRE